MHASPKSIRSSLAVATGVVLIGANLRAPITSLGPVLPDIQAAMHLDGVGAGLLNALPLLIFAVLSLFAPGVGRRFGLERVLGLALAAIMLGTLLRSAPLPGGLWSGTMLLSAGIALANVLLPGLVKRDFPRSAASMIGYYAAAMAGTAAVAAGIAFPIARSNGLDWRWALGIWALPAAVALLVWLPQMAGRQHHLTAEATTPVQGPSPWRDAIGWQVSLFFALHSLVFYSLVDWFPSYAVSHGIPPATAGVYMLGYQIVAVVTNFASVSLIRRFEDQTLLGFACGVLLVIGTAGLWLLPQWSLLWLISAGFGAGIAMVTSLSLFALRTRDHRQATVLSGMAQFVGYVVAAAGPLLVGVLHQLAGSWDLPLMFLVGASALVVVFATLAGRRRYVGDAGA